jgi:purine-binding chemotaxis protein CheW
LAFLLAVAGALRRPPSIASRYDRQNAQSIAARALTNCFFLMGGGDQQPAIKFSFAMPLMWRTSSEGVRRGLSLFYSCRPVLECNGSKDQLNGSLQKMQTTHDARGSVEALAFTLGNEEYGINILKVQEIRGYDTVTQIANAPEFIKGVINLRGIIVPIVDMRIKFNLGKPTYDQFTVVIVLNIGERVIGMVVDSVSDVITLNPEQIKPAPDLGSALKTDHLIGLGTIDERMVILVDIDKLMSSEEMGLIEKIAT